MLDGHRSGRSTGRVSRKSYYYSKDECSDALIDVGGTDVWRDNHIHYEH